MINTVFKVVTNKGYKNFFINVLIDDNDVYVMDGTGAFMLVDFDEKYIVPFDTIHQWYVDVEYFWYEFEKFVNQYLPKPQAIGDDLYRI